MLFVLHHFLPVVSLLDEQIFVGGVGLEPTCPLGSGFTGRRANQLLNPPKTFVGLREFQLLSGLPPLHFKSLKVFKCYSYKDITF